MERICSGLGYQSESLCLLPDCYLEEGETVFPECGIDCDTDGSDLVLDNSNYSTWTTDR